jgi:hypothetical protein
MSQTKKHHNYISIALYTQASINEMRNQIQNLKFNVILLFYFTFSIPEVIIYVYDSPSLYIKFKKYIAIFILSSLPC